MISWIVASHRREVLDSILLPSLHINGEDELIIIENQPSITIAYAAGQAQATKNIHVYVHHDVRVTDLQRLRQQLIHQTINHGVVGIIGSRSATLPWWTGSLTGSVVDTRLGTLNYGLGDRCAIVDGLLLATRQAIDWDLAAPGWHGYDHDACLQLLAKGYSNFCISSGHTMVEHHASSPTNMDQLVGWHEAVAHYAERWGRFSQEIAALEV